ncbi:DUF4136 domain-containing protein [Pontibacter sp. H259]|uniref:DUF4136 domain-containing protein n=1 Tax=Pontibacter sp. H259 TaxID=3133421 RepID=UPI0030C5FE5B
MHHHRKTYYLIIIQALPLVVLLLFSGCTTGPRISSSYSNATNFRLFQTYALYKAELPTSITSGPAYTPLLDQQLKLAIESELVKAGLRPSEQTPDLLIAYDIILPERQATEPGTTVAPGFGYGYSYWYGYRYRYDVIGVPGYQTIKDLPAGTLVIDLIDATTNQLVWRGWHQAELNPTAVNDSDVNKAVANVMSRYPPVPQTTQ